MGKGKKGKIKSGLVKDITNPYSFFQYNSPNQTLFNNNAFAVLGHTRMATSGAINVRNAHPIDVGNIVLCHNGGIPKFHWNRNDQDNSDSRVLAEKLNKDKLEDVLGEAGDGHYAITYADMNARKINIIRNEHRPLSFMYTASGGTLYWASEMWMLMALAAKTGESNYKEPFFAATGQLYQLDFQSARMNVTKLDIKKQVVWDRTKSKLFAEQNPRSCFICKQPDPNCDCWKQEKKTPSVPLISKQGPIFKYFGFEGNAYSLEDASKKLKIGCSACHTVVALNALAMWYLEDAYICEDCYTGDPLVEEYIIKQARVYESEFKKIN